MVFSMSGLGTVNAATKAKKVTITNAYSVMSIGQSYKFSGKLTPSKASDKITWKSSNDDIATVSKTGKVTAVSTGTVTITASLASGVKDSVKVLVVSKYGVTSLQSRIDKMLSSKNIKNVYIKNLKTAENYIIAEGKYTDKTLRINAPLSEVENSGKFKQVIINDVKNGTYIEKSRGNKLVVNDPESAIKLEEGAYIYSLIQNVQNGVLNLDNLGKIMKLILADSSKTIVDGIGEIVNLTIKGDSDVTIGKDTEVSKVVLDTENAEVTLDVDGNVTEIVLKQPMKLNLGGEGSKIKVVVEASAAGSSITSAVPVSIKTEGSISVKLESGAEGSSVYVTEDTAKVTLENKTTGSIEVEKANGDVEKVEAVVTPTPTVTPPTGGSGGTPVTPTPGVTESTTDTSAVFTLPTAITNIKTATVKTNVLGSNSYTITDDSLSFIKRVLTSDKTYYDMWYNTTDDVVKHDGIEVTVKADSVGYTKKVTFGSFILDVTVNPNVPSVNVKLGSKEFVLHSNTDLNILYIDGTTPQDILDMVSFEVTY